MPYIQPNRALAALAGALLLLSNVASRVRNALVRGSFLIVAALPFSAGEADAQQFEFENAAIRVTKTNFDETVGNAVFSLVNRASAVRNFTVSAVDGSGANAATEGSDFQRIDGSHATTKLLLFGLAARGSRELRIPIVDDSDVEGKHTFIFRVVVAQTSTTYDVPITIHDDDRAFEFDSTGITQTSFPETDSWSSFSIAVRNTASSTVAISWLTVNRTAIAGQDYTAGRRSHPAVPTGVIITANLSITNDTVAEDAETFIFRLTVDGAEYDIPLTIEKNDQPPATLSISPRTNVRIAEGQTQAYTVTLSPAQTVPVTVKCSTLDNQVAAIAGEDYDSVDTTLTFDPGVTSIAANIAGMQNENCYLRAIADGVDEPVNQIVAFGLSDAAGVAIESDGSGGIQIASGHESFNVTIVDADDPPMIWIAQANVADLSVAEGTATFEFTLMMSAASEKSDFAVGYRLGGTATPGYDVNLTPPETGEDYTVSYQLTGNALTPARQVVGTESYFGARRTNGDGQITIFAGETSKTLTVHVNDDQLKEADETIVLELLQGADQAANQALSPDATNLDDLDVDHNRNTATLTLASDENVTAQLRLQEPGAAGFTDDLRVREGGGPGEEGNVTVTFQVDLSDFDDAPSTISVSLMNDGTASAATEGEDYAPLSPSMSTLSVTTASPSPEFTVDILDDDESERREEFIVVVEIGTSFRQQFPVAIIDNDGADPILRETAKHAVARAEALVENQPRLIPMLRDPDDRSEFKLRATDGGVEAAGGFRVETVWGATTQSRSTDSGAEHRHLLTTLGAHFRTSELLHLGGMLQIDRSEMKPGGQGMSGEIGGNGWMAGPYFAARDATHPLFFEGRLLYGRASNDVEALVLEENAPARSASFDSERWLAQARVEGTYRLGNGATLIPLADLSHARDEMEPFRDSDNEQVAGQTIAVSKLQLGAELEIPVETAQGHLRFKPGLRFVASDTSGGTFSDGAAGLRLRGRIDFGIDYNLGDDFVLGFGSFYTGLGRKDLETYGAGLDLRLEF